ncbi:MAG: hypothetical protein QNJ65_07600 [Xenococcaceae cyanobacterium MO_234.B1]|nr:hypothetical protein [Xenococcaceae cyanobacterium MO_234.B1]
MIIIPKASFFHFTGDFIVGDRYISSEAKLFTYTLPPNINQVRE